MKILQTGSLAATLKVHRQGDGQWKRFPFHYTVLALSEIDTRASRAELKYAAPVLERQLRRRSGQDKFSQRRQLLAQRALEKI